ncbi:MAG: DUF1801 domain-containing protein [Bacteroidia bacterium]|nr:DUF1801 domain-containing protein [Bacteroidia bacterium]
MIQNAYEVVGLGDKAATFGVRAKKMSEGDVYILPYKKWMNLGFYQGAVLTDQAGLLEGTGKNMRQIKMRSVEGVNRTEVKELLKLAFQERKNALNK